MALVIQCICIAFRQEESDRFCGGEAPLTLPLVIRRGGPANHLSSQIQHLAEDKNYSWESAEHRRNVKSDVVCTRRCWGVRLWDDAMVDHPVVPKKHSQTQA